jgi:hypothetical protein
MNGSWFKKKNHDNLGSQQGISKDACKIQLHKNTGSHIPCQMKKVEEN